MCVCFVFLSSKASLDEKKEFWPSVCLISCSPFDLTVFEIIFTSSRGRRKCFLSTCWTQNEYPPIFWEAHVRCISLFLHFYFIYYVEWLLNCSYLWKYCTWSCSLCGSQTPIIFQGSLVWMRTADPDPLLLRINSSLFWSGFQLDQNSVQIWWSWFDQLYRCGPLAKCGVESSVRFQHPKMCRFQCVWAHLC